MKLSRTSRFEAAHKLPNHKGKCKNLHGHTYILEISVEGKVSKEGIVIDFCEIDNLVRESVINTLDHSYLNEIIENPTAENISLWVWSKLKTKLNLCEIKLWETPDSCVTYSGK
ncbi:MAG: 6-carboxytetrahydropterin synthase QueD [Nanoarchaeota archaeon]|nr:6-carboxytetrahydropterin synthase QueD [Nanoarchaeota archaeon]MBU4086139.1 6-carboxytetrahydropterin synthase QueD [Nanoarchaeota archaeon]